MHLLGLVGLTILFTHSLFFEPVRKYWPTFFGCAQCIGFWVGLFDVLFSRDPQANLATALLQAGSVSLLAVGVAIVVHKLTKEDESECPPNDPKP